MIRKNCVLFCFFKTSLGWAVVMAQAFKHSTWEAETGGYLRVQGQAGLRNEYQDSHSYTEKLSCKGFFFLKKKKRSGWLEKWFSSYKPLLLFRRTHIMCSKNTCDSSSGNLPSTGLHKDLHTHIIYRHTCIHIKKNKNL